MLTIRAVRYAHKMIEAAHTLTEVGTSSDDLTSAPDGAGFFVERGSTCDVNRGSIVRSGADVVSADTQNRSTPEARAARAAQLVTAALENSRALYRTIDSTLHGRVRAEVTAAFRASGRKLLVIAPAFTVRGRITVRGIQLVGGRLVSETAYRDNPVHPVRTSQITDLVDPSFGTLAVIPVASDGGSIASSADVLVLDAES